MATTELDFLHSQLEKRKQRLETAIAIAPQNDDLTGLLREVDSALERFAAGTYGLCEECHDSVERDRLLCDPLIRYCLDHLTKTEREALQRDLDLASQLQRKLLPPGDLCAAGWETSYHYAPVGPVSGDYCDLFASDGQLYFVLGDVSGKGVAASMRMTQLHALFRSLVGMGMPLAEIIAHVNCFLSSSSLAGQYATLVCGQAKRTGEVEFFNAGHLPVIVTRPGGAQRFEFTGLPLGMFPDVAFHSTSLQLNAGDTLFLYTDGLSEARRAEDEYGLDRIANLALVQAARSPAELISAFLQDLRTFADGLPMDDLTLLAIRRLASFTEA
jgi:phosphoserine phosphatase RsbU/P